MKTIFILIITCLTAFSYPIKSFFCTNILEIKELNNISAESALFNTLIIDPGHGGKDHGCSKNNHLEKNIVLIISTKLGQLINSKYPEIKIIYTRRNDKFVSLQKRAEIANENEASLFLSIHCNAMNNAESVKGSETYVMGMNTTEDNLNTVLRENQSIYFEDDHQQTYESFDLSPDEGNILMNMFQNNHLEESLSFANKIEQEFIKISNYSSRGIKQAGFVVLHQTTMPSVLVETGYLTNSRDRKLLTTQSGQETISMALFLAFENYYLQKIKTPRNKLNIIKKSNIVKIEK